MSDRRWPIVVLIVLGIGLMVSSVFVTGYSTRYVISAIPFGAGLLLVFWAIRLRLRRSRR